MRAWEGDWKARLGERLLLAGFATASAYADAHPLRSLVELASQLGGDVVAVQILWQLRAEAESDPPARSRLARSLLARELVSAIPDGWGDVERCVLAMGSWAGSLDLDFPAMSAVFARLRELAPRGWRPSGPDDPILLEAFRDWPT